jgi:hypothetical protein
MKHLKPLFIVFALAIASFAQTAPEPAPAPNDGVHIDLSAAYSFVNSTPTINGNDSVSATVLTARLPITDRFALRYEMINLPTSNAQINLGEIEYRRSAADFLKSPSLRIDPKKYDLFAYGGFGGKRQDATSTPAFSYIAGGGLDYKLTDVVAVRVVDIAYVRSTLDQRGLVLQNHLQFAPGISLRF